MLCSPSSSDYSWYNWGVSYLTSHWWLRCCPGHSGPQWWQTWEQVHTWRICHMSPVIDQGAATPRVSSVRAYYDVSCPGKLIPQSLSTSHHPGLKTREWGEERQSLVTGHSLLAAAPPSSAHTDTPHTWPGWRWWGDLPWRRRTDGRLSSACCLLWRQTIHYPQSTAKRVLIASSW